MMDALTLLSVATATQLEAAPISVLNKNPNLGVAEPVFSSFGLACLHCVASCILTDIGISCVFSVNEYLVSLIRYHQVFPSRIMSD